MKYKPLLFLVATLLLSCECPYLEEDRIDSLSYISSNGDVFYAEKLLGTWQCYYPMIIGGMEFKQIKFMSNNLSGHPCKPYDKGVQIVVYSDYTTKTIIIE